MRYLILRKAAHTKHPVLGKIITRIFTEIYANTKGNKITLMYELVWTIDEF